MPVLQDEDPMTTFTAVAADLTATAADPTMTFDDSLGGSLDTTTTAFVPPVESDMASVDSIDSCKGPNMEPKLPSVPTAEPSCECDDFFLGSWDAGAAWFGFTCNFRQCPEGSTGEVDGTQGRDGDSGCVVSPGYSGKAVALNVWPWVNSTITAVEWYVR